MMGTSLLAVSFLNSVDESWHEHEMLVSALEGAFKDGDRAGVVCEFAAFRFLEEIHPTIRTWSGKNCHCSFQSFRLPSANDHARY